MTSDIRGEKLIVVIRRCDQDSATRTLGLAACHKITRIALQDASSTTVLEKQLLKHRGADAACSRVVVDATTSQEHF